MLSPFALVTLSLPLYASGSPLQPRQQQQQPRFNPNPNSGFDDPTFDIANPAFGTAIAAGYQGPFASQIDPSLVGPVSLVRSGTLSIGAVSNYTLPLYYSVSTNGSGYWWVTTDSSDKGNAAQLGINFSSKLKFAAQSLTANGMRGAEDVQVVDNTVVGRRGMVDFSPVRKLVAGNGTFAFPPAVNDPGSVGDEYYTPMIRLTNAGDEIWNAPIIAGVNADEAYLNQFCDGVPESMREDFYSKVHDRVLAICPSQSTVTIQLIKGFSFNKPVLYFAFDSSDPVPATIDDTNYAPRLQMIETGGDDSLFSGVERFFVATNGFTNADLPPGAPNNETHHP